MRVVINLCHIQELTLACFVHGGGQQELEGLLDFVSLGDEEGGEGLGLGRGGLVGFIIVPLLTNDRLAGHSKGYQAHTIPMRQPSHQLLA